MAVLKNPPYLTQLSAMKEKIGTLPSKLPIELNQCQRIGFPPISIMGLGRRWVSSLMRVPKPPASMTAFIFYSNNKKGCQFFNNA